MCVFFISPVCTCCRRERLLDKTGKPWRPFAEKSTLLYMWLIMKYTQPGDMVADLFGGTCNSAIAAHACKRPYVVGAFCVCLRVLSS